MKHIANKAKQHLEQAAERAAAAGLQVPGQACSDMHELCMLRWIANVARVLWKTTVRCSS